MRSSHVTWILTWLDSVRAADTCLAYPVYHPLDKVFRVDELYDGMCRRHYLAYLIYQLSKLYSKPRDGELRRWLMEYDANRGCIPDPASLLPGQESIPKSPLAIIQKQDRPSFARDLRRMLDDDEDEGGLVEYAISQFDILDLGLLQLQPTSSRSPRLLLEAVRVVLAHAASIDLTRQYNTGTDGDRRCSRHQVDTCTIVPSITNRSRGSGLPLMHCLWLCAVHMAASDPTSPIITAVGRVMQLLQPLHAATESRLQDELTAADSRLTEKCHRIFQQPDDVMATPALTSILGRAEPSDNIEGLCELYPQTSSATCYTFDVIEVREGMLLCPSYYCVTCISELSSAQINDVLHVFRLCDLAMTFLVMPPIGRYLCLPIALTSGAS